MRKILVSFVAVMSVSVASVAIAPPPGAEAATVTKFSNCKKMQAKYKHGVGRPGAKDKTSSKYKVKNFKVDKALYNKNKTLDRDHDGIACEHR